MKSLRTGEALALQRRLPAPPDRLAFYAALTDNGRRKDTMLLERSAGPSFLMEKAAVRAECRGGEVVLAALSENGELVLASVAANLSERVAEKEERRLVLRFPRPEGADAEARLLAPSPFDALRALTGGFAVASKEEPFTIHCLGVLAFDQADLFEDLPAPAEDPLQFPDFVFWLAESLIVFEQGAQPRVVCTAFGSDDPVRAERAYFSAAERLASLVARCEAASATQFPEPPRPSPPTEVEVDLDDAAYRDVVVKLREKIAAGEIYQIVPSRTFRAPCLAPILSYAALRKLDPSPYQFFVSGPDHILFGASPETSVRVFDEEKSQMVEVKPIAGTRRRGATSDEDDRLEAELRLDHKEAAEHMMLVDLARNDVARVSMPGTRRVGKLMTVERYARVMHLVSSVTGALRTGLDSLHALQACLNVGTLTGAPKIRATQLLRQTEITKRGPYGGAIGWLNGDGLMDTGVVIRSAVVKDGTAFVRAGAGVVYDSDPQREADETRQKASAVLSVLAVGGESQ
jgi:anthranilate synthase component 1